MPKTYIITVKKVEVTGIQVKVNEQTGLITEMPISLYLTTDAEPRSEIFLPWVKLSPTSQQKVGDVLAEVNGLIQDAYLT